jgi:hypothetical protein
MYAKIRINHCGAMKCLYAINKSVYYLKECCDLGFKLKTKQLEIVEMFWQVSSALTCRRAWIQTHARVGISLNNTV